MSQGYMGVRSSEPPASSRTIELNLRPRPVSVTVPTMMPAPAQVAATFSTPSEPPASAFTSPESHRPRATGTFLLKTWYGMSAVSALRKLVTAETSVAQNTAITGEKPHSMNTTIDTSDRKWNQYFLLRLHADSTRSNVTSFMPNLRTSISTMANSAR